MPVAVMLTANHQGYFYYRICKMDGAAESKECFEANPLKLVNGDSTYPVTGTSTGWYNMTLRLPEITCKHCVLQWTYNVGK